MYICRRIFFVFYIFFNMFNNMVSNILIIHGFKVSTYFEVNGASWQSVYLIFSLTTYSFRCFIKSKLFQNVLSHTLHLKLYSSWSVDKCLYWYVSLIAFVYGSKICRSYIKRHPGLHVLYQYVLVFKFSYQNCGQTDHIWKLLCLTS